jgi:hypothetical protein
MAWRRRTGTSLLSASWWWAPLVTWPRRKSSQPSLRSTTKTCCPRQARWGEAPLGSGASSDGGEPATLPASLPANDPPACFLPLHLPAACRSLQNFSVYGYARSKMSDDEFRELIASSLTCRLTNS